MSWPRLYSLTLPQLRALPQAEQDRVWAEYEEFWRSAYHGVPIRQPDEFQLEYQKDFTEDQNGDFR